MQSHSRAEQIFIAWNGLQLNIPGSWDLRIGGHRSLIFEKDFHPQLQLRWEKAVRSTAIATPDTLTAFVDRLGKVMAEPPAPWSQLQQTFSHVTCYQRANGTVGGGACICPHCSTVITFQLLADDPAAVNLAVDCFKSLSCHPGQDNLWRVQDLSLITPPSFVLTDYTFGAGLTRLSFSNRDLLLHTCRIAAADDRLSNQTLQDILLTLANVEELDIFLSDDSVCQGYRQPSIPRQILFRMRREQPFVWAKIWHDSNRNRLLAVVFLANRPIPEETAAMICEHYEIVNEKETS